MEKHHRGDVPSTLVLGSLMSMYVTTGDVTLVKVVSPKASPLVAALFSLCNKYLERDTVL